MAACSPTSGPNTTGCINFYCVKDYGAKGDGVTDDTSCIQSAINAMQPNGPFTFPNGGVLWFPPGIYLVSSSPGLIINRPMRFEGSGVQATFLRAHNSPSGDLINVVGIGVEISHLTIDSDTVRTGGAFVNFNSGVSRIFMHDFELTSPYVGLYFPGGAQDIWLTNGIIEAVVSKGIWFSYTTSGGTQIANTNVFLKSISIEQSSAFGQSIIPNSVGIQIDRSGNLNITDCAITFFDKALLINGGVVFASTSYFDTSNYGIYISCSDSTSIVENCRFTNCETDSATIYGIYIDPTPGGQITGIVISGHQSVGVQVLGTTTQQAGVYLGRGTNIKILGGDFLYFNTTQSTNYAPIVVGLVQNLIIANNTIYDFTSRNPTYSITFLTSSLGNNSFVIANNILRGGFGGPNAPNQNLAPTSGLNVIGPNLHS